MLQGAAQRQDATMWVICTIGMTSNDVRWMGEKKDAQMLALYAAQALYSQSTQPIIAAINDPDNGK